MTKKSKTLDKLSDTMANGLQALLVRLEATEKFVLDQAPAVCKEILVEKVIDTVTSMVVSGIVFGLGAFAVNSAHAMEASRDFFDKNVVAGLGYMVMAGATIALIAAVNNLFTVKFCPKLVLIREVKYLITPHPTTESEE